MVRIEFHPEAAHEVDAIIDWYEGQRAGLGPEFFAQLGRDLQTIAENPRMSPPWPDARARAQDVRRLIMGRFPFALPYIVREDLVVVLAIAHVRRRPEYWLKRTKPQQRR
jgi:toxin ParE1/3/4